MSYFERYVDLLVDRPRRLIGIALCVTLVCSIVVLASQRLPEDLGVYEFLCEGPLTQEMDAYNAAYAMQDPPILPFPEKVQPRPAEFALSFLYRWNDAARRREDIVTPANLQHMCEVENMVLQQPVYGSVCLDVQYYAPGLFSLDNATGSHCTVPGSITSLFYIDWAALLPFLASTIRLLAADPMIKPLLPILLPPKKTDVAIGTIFDGGHVRNCQLLADEYVSARWAQLTDFAASLPTEEEGASEHELLIGTFIDALVVEESDETGATARTQANALFAIGWPFANFSSERDRPATQIAMYRELIAGLKVDYAALTGAVSPYLLSSNLRGKSVMGEMEVLFGYSLEASMTELQVEVMSGVAYTSLAMVLVFLISVYYMGSVRLAACGMAINLATLPIGYLLFIIEIPITPQMVILVTFVVIGIGAANLFVYLDTWRVTGAWQMGIRERVSYTISRTGKSILTTNLTTAISFYSLLATPLPSMSALGVLTGNCIAFLFLVSVSLWPCFLLLYGADTPSPADVTAAERGSPARCGGPLRQAFARLPLLGSVLERRIELGAVRVRVASVVVAAVLVWAVWAAKLASELKPPAEMEQVITDDNQMLRQLAEKPDVKAMQLLAEGTLTFGLEGFYPNGRYDLVQDRGRVAFDRAFDLSDPAQMSTLAEFMRWLHAAECPGQVVCVEPGTLLSDMQQRPFGLELWLEERNGTLPSSEDLAAELKAWLAGKANLGHRNEFGFVGGRLSYVSLPLVFGIVFMGGENDFMADTAVVTRWMRDEVLPAQLGGVRGLESAMFVIGGHSLNAKTGWPMIIDMYNFSMMYPTMSINLLRNVVGCLFVSFIILFWSTRSPLLSLCGCVSVTCVLCSVFGLLKLLGKQLTLNNMISSSLVVGFSFDYALHFVCCYKITGGTVQERVARSISHLWLTLIGSMLTTVAALVLLLGPGMPFLNTVAIVILLGSPLSVVLTLFFLASLCIVLAPDSSGGLKATRGRASEALAEARDEEVLSHVELVG